MDMDLSSMWFPELELEDQEFMNHYDKVSKPYDTVDNLSADSFSSESYTKVENIMDRSFRTQISLEEKTEMKLPSYQKAASSINKRSQTPNTLAVTSLSSSSETFTISFGDLNPKDDIPSFDNSLGYETISTGKVQMKAKKPVQIQDHVLAERKRREKLTRHFVSLSSLLPKLRKMEKATILEDATKYIQELQDRVKELEGLSGAKRMDAKEYIIELKRPRHTADDQDGSSSNETNPAINGVDVCRQASADVEVQISGSSVLVRILSQKNSSLLVKVIRKMQELGLSVISSNAMPFANTTTLIIVAQIEGDFFLTATDIVKNLEPTL